MTYVTFDADRTPSEARDRPVRPLMTRSAHVMAALQEAWRLMQSALNRHGTPGAAAQGSGATDEFTSSAEQAAAGCAWCDCEACNVNTTISTSSTDRRSPVQREAVHRLHVVAQALERAHFVPGQQLRQSLFKHNLSRHRMGPSRPGGSQEHQFPWHELSCRIGGARAKCAAHQHEQHRSQQALAVAPPSRQADHLGFALLHLEKRCTPC